MTQEQMEVRIIRLEETVMNLLQLRDMLLKIIDDGEQMVKRSDEVIKSCQEIQMDLAKLGLKV